MLKMSRTYRLIKYIKGKPMYFSNENKYPPYHFYKHETRNVRKDVWKSYRHRCKENIKKDMEMPKFYKTYGWMTW